MTSTNQKHANEHKKWVEKLHILREELGTSPDESSREKCATPLSTLKHKNFHEIVRKVIIVYEKLNLWGDAKKNLHATKLAKTHGYQHHGKIPNDTDIKKADAIADSLYQKVEKPLIALYESYNQAQSFPLPFDKETHEAMQVLNKFLRHLKRKFRKGLDISMRQKLRKSLSHPSSNQFQLTVA